MKIKSSKKLVVGFWVLSAFILFFLSSCSGFMAGNEGGRSNGKSNIDSLMLSDGSGYLSSLDHNDISPFLYREGDRAWLFFSSDREGHYQIYFAEMDGDGRFFGLTKMDSNINSSSDEFSPVVFQAGLYAGGSSYNTNHFISFLKVTGSSTDVYTTTIDSNFTGQAPASLSVSSAAATHISLYNKANGYSSFYLLTGNGTSAINGYQWESLTTSNWVSYLPLFDAGKTGLINGMDGFTAPSPYNGELFLMDMFANNSQHQLYFAAIWTVYSPTNGGPVIYVTNISPIPDYGSGFDDGFPNIDLSSQKVYFSSKRNGRGFWNLYRFNIHTFDKEIPWNMDSTNSNLYNLG